MKKTIYIIFDVLLVSLILFWPWLKNSPILEVVPLAINLEKNLVDTSISENQELLFPGDILPILMFHYIRDPEQLPAWDSTGRSLSVSATRFEEFLKEIKSEQIEMISLKTAVSQKLTKRSVVLTFDDGYEDFYLKAWPILKKYKAKATVFVITERINQPGYLSGQEIQELARTGIEIGSHTQSHPNLKNTSHANLKIQLENSKSELESLIGQPVYTLAYPSGQYDETVVKAVDQANYLAAVTTQERVADLETDSLLALPRIRMRTKTNLSEALKTSGFLFDQ